MPKVSSRCRRRVAHDSVQVVSPVAFTAPPRKVSFEDGLTEPEEGQASTSSPTIKSLSRRPTLVRPKSSLSLVELAKDIESEKSSLTDLCTSSAPISPIMSPKAAEIDCPMPSSLPSSPWGQFVDMAIADDPYHLPVPHQSYGTPCNCCTSCRRRRASPYGEYRRSKCCSKVVHTISLLKVSNCKSQIPSFRLAPRKSKEATDLLVGALDRLQVD